MVFNSLSFVIFFIIVYGLYLVLPHRWQNRLLLAASYFFYGWWDWRFLSLLFLSTAFAFWCGNAIARAAAAKDLKRKRMFMWAGVAGNLLVLGFFKYLNFFIENAQALLHLLGLNVAFNHLNIILPLGISFYTFQKISYILEIDRGLIKPARKFTDFMLFASFFPQLVAGPIERGRNLLPQIENRRSVTIAGIQEGCYLILWGYFLKVFAADNLGRGAVSAVFDNAPPYNGIEVWLAGYAFTFQVYCDFAGYSNIARGLGKLMGVDLMFNFNLPFFVTNIQDFWKRWHISLTSWIQDYLYYPLFHALRRVKGNLRIYLTILITMSVIGLWHGARWNFVIFGAYHGLLIIGYLMIQARWGKFIRSKPPVVKTVVFWLQVILMFHLVAAGMLIFRAQSMVQFAALLQGLTENFRLTEGFPLFKFLKSAVNVASAVWFILAVEYIQFKKKNLLAVLQLSWGWQAVVYFMLLLLLLTFGVGGGKEFIYFQF